jgi:23S rRNA (pseudouridine1915-N3)-methyltransferase
MHWRVITVGKPALSWARQGAEDYLKRLQRTGRHEWVVIKEGPPEGVVAKMLAASEGHLKVVLDERGVAWRSMDLAHWIEARQQEGVKRAALLIGGAEGHSQSLRDAADVCWSLSKLTLQHELALTVALEQLYRAGSILRGEPYHREG